jgi:hypothetical protein
MPEVAGIQPIPAQTHLLAMYNSLSQQSKDIDFPARSFDVTRKLELHISR